MIFLALAIFVPVPTMAGVNINIGIALPPPVVFAGPPDVIVLPATSDVYVVPGIEIDLFFWNGWWWRPWEGRWYRSRYYDRGWVYYNAVPRFYFDVDPGWRGYYRDHIWYGHRWDYQVIPYRSLQQNWRTWHDRRYWERQKTWGVQGYKRPPQKQMLEQRNQRKQQYQQRPEVQQHQQWLKEQKKQPRVQQPRGQERQRESQQPKSRGEHEQRDMGHGR